MTKETIAVDVDDVIAAENEGVRRFINQEYVESHSPEDYLVEGEYWGYWENIWEVDEEEGARRLEAFLNSPIKDDLKLVQGAARAIAELKKKYELVVVTSRYGRQLETTEPWLEKHFPSVFKQVAFVATWNKAEKVSKAIICQEIGASYLIDDNAGHCNLVAEAGIEALLFGDYGWNRKSELRPGVTRVKNWSDVLEYFDGRS